ncbi:MAG: helix-turn-helix domain-containing protein [Actinomycetota bacterium]|jgi:HTH-type transcriptional regulator / antitoxin HipB
MSTIVRIEGKTPGMSQLEGSVEHDRSLGAAVRARRRQLGLTQEDLAALAGCARRTVNAIEGGKETIRLSVLLDVLGALGLRLRVEPGRGGLVADA